MGIRFVLGPSGSGKSTYVQEELIRESGESRNRNFFLIVPDQYTMQTQSEMAVRHPSGGILNIDVLSFGRLKHSIFEEVGRDKRIPLDDTGKCLILRKIMGEKKDELKVLKKGIKNPGCVEEVKSILCEFMQYGIAPEDLDSFAEDAGRHLNLVYKLQDLKLLYEAFLGECHEKYLTSEESLTLLCERIPLSKRFKDSVIAFDGFTGFTPIQLNVILTLARYGREVMITLPFDGRYDAYGTSGEEFFLHLTQKTVKGIKKRAEEEKIPVLKEVILSGEEKGRFKENSELYHLENNLFRQEASVYKGAVHQIEVVKAGSVEQECRLACKWMFERIKEEGLRYRDIAIITGDMNTYREPLKEFFVRYGVPYFMDATVNMLKNPFIQFLRAYLNLLNYDFIFKDCMTFLRSGYVDITMEEADLFENYLRAKGIRGAYAFRKPFLKPSRSLKDKPEAMETVNAVRERFIQCFDRFGQVDADSVKPAKEWAESFYYFLTDLNLSDKLHAQSEAFAEKGDLARAKEFGQLYRYVIDLLDQIVGLISDEPVTLKAFAEILEAGYGEIRIGILPQGVDVLMVGDMQRTRLNEVKALLFLGVNDGNIPKAAKKGGIISDLERDILVKAGKELAPTPAQQIFIERLYLYLTVTKPKERLYLSYASVSEDGEKRIPSYFIKTLKELFPELKEQYREKEIPLLSVLDEKEQFSRLLSQYASGVELEGEDLTRLMEYYGDFLSRKDLKDWSEKIVDYAFSEYVPEALRKEIAKELYGEELRCSASSLEKFAACQYAHFLGYGLHLAEREEAHFERRDFGSLNHEFLERFGKSLLAEGRFLNDISKEELDAKADAVLDDFIKEDKWGIFEDGERGNYLAKQVKRLMKRSLSTIQKQLSRGEFNPEYFEVPFGAMLSDSDGENKIRLNGRIDRIDLCRKDGKIYVKIVDYKTGGKEFKPDLFEMGLELQLAIYLKQAVSEVREKNPDFDVIPAAMLYYHVQDPFIEAGETASEGDLEKARMEKLNHSGIVSNDPAVVTLLDGGLTGKSDVIPVKVLKDGTVGASGAATPEYLKAMLSYAENMVGSLSDKIYQGEMAINPVSDDKYNACAYCAFKDACPYDDKIKGYRKRKVEPAKGVEEDSAKEAEGDPA